MVQIAPWMLAVVGLMALASPALANETDPHLLFETKCGTCHVPHGGEFVAQSVIADGTELIGKSSQMPVRGFLEAGHGRLSDVEIEVMMDHLTSIQDSGQLFMDKCTICHGRAVVLSQLSLVLRDGEPWGRYTDRRVEEFLQNHGRLTQDEIPIIMGAFVRQLVPPQ